jgi:hypothetical protein
MIVAASEPAAPPEPLKIDVLVKQPEPKCEAKTHDEIVVCAEQEDPELHRLRPIPNAAKYEKDESKAEFSIGENATVAAEVDSADMAGGVVSKRMMVRLKVKF